MAWREFVLIWCTIFFKKLKLNNKIFQFSSKICLQICIFSHYFPLISHFLHDSNFWLIYTDKFYLLTSLFWCFLNVESGHENLGGKIKTHKKATNFKKNNTKFYYNSKTVNKIFGFNFFVFNFSLKCQIMLANLL
jgi:hypothetical protein